MSICKLLLLAVFGRSPVFLKVSKNIEGNIWDVLQNVLQKVILKEEVVLGFEWNEQKSIVNLRKHGIAFEEATEVFLDDNRLEMYDVKHSEDEDRYITIGKVKKVLFVVYVERDANIRIISARLATKREESMYYGNSIL